VLEGGYSIEGALPYVNLGILLAMSGIDYSRVKEPLYDPEKYRQTPEVTMNIEKTGETVLSYWRNRRELAEKMRAKKILMKENGYMLRQHKGRSERDHKNMPRLRRSSQNRFNFRQRNPPACRSYSSEGLRKMP
jgi:hypothetical protein